MQLITDRDHISTSVLEGVHIEHHGILGQKWGIRRFQNKDGSLTAAGKQRYGSDKPEGDSFHNTVTSLGFKKSARPDLYGENSYEKEWVSKNGTKTTIHLDLDSGFSKNKLSTTELSKMISDIDKNKEAIDLDLRKRIADRIVSDPMMIKTAYGWEGATLTDQQKRERLVNDLGKQETFTRGLVPGYANWRIMSDGLGEIGYDDGGAYGDHYLMTDIDWKTRKIANYVSING